MLIAQPDTDEYGRFLRWRGVEDPCLMCHGAGVRGYGSGATWRGGAGTASVENDVCDVCWGSGDRFQHGVDLRQLRDEEAARVNRVAVERLASACGADMKACWPAVYRIVAALEKLADRRGAPAAPYLPELARGLAKALRSAMAAR